MQRAARRATRVAEKAAQLVGAGDPTPEQETHNRYAHQEIRERWCDKPVHVRRNVTARPIDRYRARRAFTDLQWHACDKYRTDYDRGAFEGRVTANYEPGGGSTCSAPVGHLPASLIQLDARSRLREARHALPRRLVEQFDMIVLAEVEPSDIVGANTRRDATLAIERLRICADVLCDFYRL